MFVAVYFSPLAKLDYIEEETVDKDKLGFDQVYMINLERRPDRRTKMLQCFDQLGIDAKIVNAVDGKYAALPASLQAHLHYVLFYMRLKVWVFNKVMMSYSRLWLEHLSSNFCDLYIEKHHKTTSEM